MAVNKPVYFNEENDQDRMILEHIRDMKFATYVKKLILADMKNPVTEEKATSNDILHAINNIAELLKQGVVIGNSCAGATEKSEMDMKRVEKFSKFENMTL